MKRPFDPLYGPRCSHLSSQGAGFFGIGLILDGEGDDEYSLHGDGQGFGGYSGVGVLADAASGPAAVAPGFSYTVTNSLGDISAVLNALSQESLVNIISTPSVMVLDNHPAYIQVGEQIPVRRGTTVTDGGTTTENIEYRDTGVLLNVRPSVNAGGLISVYTEIHASPREKAMRDTECIADTLTRAVVDGDGTLGQLVRSDSLYLALTGSVVRADSLLAGLLSGEGSAGRMFTDEELYEELLRTLVELNGMLEDVRRDPSRFVPEISVF